MVRYRQIAIVVLISIVIFLLFAIEMPKKKYDTKKMLESIVVVHEGKFLKSNELPPSHPARAQGKESSPSDSKAVISEISRKKSPEEMNAIRSLPMNYLLDERNDNSKIVCSQNTCEAQLYLRRDATKREIDAFMREVQRSISYNEKSKEGFALDIVSFGANMTDKTNYVEFSGHQVR